MDEYMGTIKAFGFNYAPTGWAQCNGQLLPIAQYSAVFSLLGTMYGGDGVSTFALPDLRGRTMVNMGQAPGLSNYTQGEVLGTETYTLSVANLPAHSHQMMATTDGATVNTAGGSSLASNPRGGAMPNIYETGANNQTPMASATAMVGSNLPINNLQPTLAVNYCICLQGIYPSRS